MQWSPQDNWLDPEEYKYHHSKQGKKCHRGFQLLSCCQNLISLTLLHTTGTSQKQKVSHTTKILETPMSTYRNKRGVRRIVQDSSRRFGLQRTGLTEAFVAVCFDSAHPTYLETICVH